LLFSLIGIDWHKLKQFIWHMLKQFTEAVPPGFVI